MERDVIHIQRGEPYRRVLLVEASTNSGSTWYRVHLAGYEFAQDIRTSASETADLLLSIRSDDANHYAELETVAVEASTAGVISIDVPRAVIASSIPAATLVHDWALIEPNGDPQYQAGGPAIGEGRITVIEEPTP